jgi:hypothetical protein
MTRATITLIAFMLLWFVFSARLHHWCYTRHFYDHGGSCSRPCARWGADIPLRTCHSLCGGARFKDIQ